MADAHSRIAEPVPGFELSLSDLDPPRATISAIGDFDVSARSALVDAFRELEETNHRIVRFDMSQATFFGCSCLQVLVSEHERLLDRHGLLIVGGVSGPIARILAITGLEDRLFVVAEGQDGSPRRLTSGPMSNEASDSDRVAVGSFDAVMAVADEFEPRSSHR